ncbi:transcription-repair coupling factor [Eubacteriales bacterium OttesenSCG-928-N14]|nr:transcription-repair coupling factor [Eubacteriales bacterium OttesenSCG-928-N14]
MQYDIYQPLRQAPQYQRLLTATRGGETPASVIGVAQNAKPALLRALFGDLQQPVLLISANDYTAQTLYTALASSLEEACMLLPARPIQMTKALAANQQANALRISALAMLSSGKPCIVVAGVDAVRAAILPQKNFAKRMLQLQTGMRLDLEDLAIRLVQNGYQRVDTVQSVGEFAIRGGIVDIYPPGEGNALRMDFFGDEIDTIKYMDVLSQRSHGSLQEALLPPACEAPLSQEQLADLLHAANRKLANAPQSDAKERLRQTIQELELGNLSRAHELLSFLPQKERVCAADYLQHGILVLDEPSRLQSHAKDADNELLSTVKELAQRGDAPLGWEQQLLGYETIADNGSMQLHFSSMDRSLRGDGPRIPLQLKGIPSYFGRMELLSEDLLAKKQAGYAVAMAMHNTKQCETLQRTLLDRGVETAILPQLNRALNAGEIVITLGQIGAGYDLEEAKFTAIAEGEIYRVVSQAPRQQSAAEQLDAVISYKVGDPLVHDVHGIGIYKGLQTIEVDGSPRDFMMLEYRGGDKLYVPADQMGRVHAYIGSDSGSFKVNKMGGQEWDRAKNKARSGVKKLAQDLVAIYAARQAQRGYAFSPDTPYQAEFEAAFQFDETQGQEQSILEIKRDMESNRIMDRLLCGDVGYGKTEVAMRAAFKCVMDAKQVMFLVPTTILAQQHYTTLTARFDGYPVTIEMLSRFKSAAEQKDIIAQFNEGKIDILIGTHKLLNKQVKPHDLGLLIVDEEQRFGVGHKETIKDLKRTVDVLTLTATPIPRTLEMSLIGIRDLSIIHTPPEHRLPINTYVAEYSDELLAEALLRELSRGGQAYVVYNQVKTMERYLERVRNLLPDANITMAHGQMPESVLEAAVLSFYSGEEDVLISSTIIENGLDIPSANTIVVCDADRLGLAQLYQLRGRVGRSARSAYCYFTYRPECAITETAQRRLAAIEEFTELGSGFKIALRDLEIRGAGNVLGPEQSGHMQQVGYDTYCRLLAEAVKEAKGEPVEAEIECVIDTDLGAYIPDSYMQSRADKVEAYRKIASIHGYEDAQMRKKELQDRFGNPPEEVLRLIDISLLRALSEHVGITSIAMREGLIRLKFSPRAKVDVHLLMRQVQQAGKGASILPGSPPSVMIRKKGMETAGLFTLAMAFVQGLQTEVELNDADGI